MDPDQTARMRRLIWIHAGRKTHYVGFVMARLIYRSKTILLRYLDENSTVRL
jgi:hypothetical protein